MGYFSDIKDHVFVWGLYFSGHNTDNSIMETELPTRLLWIPYIGIQYHNITYHSISCGKYKFLIYLRPVLVLNGFIVNLFYVCVHLNVIEIALKKKETCEMC